MYEQAQDRSLTVNLEKETCTLKDLKMVTWSSRDSKGKEENRALFKGREKVS